MPIHRQTLLADLKRWVTRFENDLREQCQEVPELDARLQGQYDLAKKAGRTALTYSIWRDGELTQGAVGWVLSCVFVRFLEDNGLLETPFLSGTGEARQAASDIRTAYFKVNPGGSDNDYLRHVFEQVSMLPGVGELMDLSHTLCWVTSTEKLDPNGKLGDAAKEFIEFWRRIDPDSGTLAHDFADPAWDTRFLGDLYQDLSESARKKYALLQTPDFVEQFILDRTLDPAIDTFGLEEVRMIDPTCGSGHFLLGGFRRLLRLWQAARPDLDERELAAHALGGVYGVDINPFAAAIARFRLLLEAWRFCGVKQLRHAPAFQVNLAVGDSLIFGARFDSKGQPYVTAHQTQFGGEETGFKDEFAHCFAVEDAKELNRILGRQYHAVVGNPPYITVKDKALNQLYRERYDACHRQYALSVPFMERFFDLALTGSGDGRHPAGYTGQITSNSFMKREFGKKLIEAHIPKWDLTHVIDTSGAYIPGHGTPTVILFGRNARPAAATVRTVMGIKGEPATPEDPARGKVWSAILDQVDRPGSESEFVSAADTEREKFHRHPWSIGGGGAAELRIHLEDASTKQIKAFLKSVGFASFPGLDDAFVVDETTLHRTGIPREFIMGFVTGDCVRDWNNVPTEEAFAPYDSTFELIPLDSNENWARFLWLNRLPLGSVVSFGGKTRLALGDSWWGWYRWVRSKYETPLSITFAFVATHNHFVLDRGGKVFNRSAPVIKLSADATEDDHLRLLGLLNSSAACFWMKQVFHCKGSTVDTRGARQTTVPFEDFYEFDGTKLKQFPIPAGSPLLLARELDRLSQSLSRNSPDALVARDAISADAFARAEIFASSHRATMIALQEELDWQCYRLYGLIDADDALEWPESLLEERQRPTLHPEGPELPGLTLGQRAFEILLARRMKEESGSMKEEAEGGFHTTWFERHQEAGSRPITELPDHWPADYRALVERRLAAIETHKNLNLIERPEYKRRWNTVPWAKRQQAALRKWLLTRLEAYFHDADRMVPETDEPEPDLGTATEPIDSFPSPTRAERLAGLHPVRARFAAGSEPRLATTRQLATAAATDPQWMEAAAVYAGRPDFEVPKLVEALVLAESVPALPADRYRAPGLRKRVEWERTWERQRLEDAVELRITKDESGREKGEEELKKQVRAAQLAEVGDIPVPPKYGAGDFAKTSYWKLRGKLDVPKERWILYPGAEGGHDDSPVIAWAGWDHAQQAQALAGFYQQAKTGWGWEEIRLVPLLAALKELLPWLHQWHDAIDPRYRQKLSTIYEQFYQTERQALRLTEEDVEAVRMQ